MQKSLFDVDPYAVRLKNAVQAVSGQKDTAPAAANKPQEKAPVAAGHRVDSVNGIYIVRRPDGSAVKDYMTTNRANAESKARALDEDLAKSDKKAPEDGKNEQVKASGGGQATGKDSLQVENDKYTVKAVSGGHAIIAPDGSQYSWGTNLEAIERRAKELNSAVSKKENAVDSDQKVKQEAENVPYSRKGSESKAKRETPKISKTEEKLARLERILADQEGDESIIGTFKTVSSKVIKDGGPVAEAFGELFGKTVVFFEAGNKHNAKFHGVVAPALIPDTIFIEAGTDKAALRVAGHELVHLIKADSPEIYKDLELSILDMLSDKAFPEYKTLLDGLGYKNMSSEDVVEELIGDFVGDQMSNSEFWGKLARREPGLFKRVAALVQDLFTKIKNWLASNGYESSQFFKNVSAAQDAVIKNIAAYGRKKTQTTGIKRVEEAVRQVIGKKADSETNNLRMVAQAIAEAKKDRSGLATVATAIKNSYAGQKATGFKAAEKGGKTFEGPYDGKTRFEVDDSKAQWKISAGSLIEDPKNPNQMAVVEKLGDIFDHPELFKNYPALKNLPTKILINPDFAPTGAYYPKSGNIVLAVPDLEVGRKVLLHEIQHSIQEVEGFAKGGNWRDFAQTRKDQIAVLEEKVGELNKKLKKAVGTPDYKRLMSERENVVDEIIRLEGKHEAGADFAGYEDYRRTAGEIEARDVEDRSDLTAEEREEFEPFSSAEYEPDNAIVMFSKKWKNKSTSEIAKEVKPAATEKEALALDNKWEGRGYSEAWETIKRAIMHGWNSLPVVIARSISSETVLPLGNSAVKMFQDAVSWVKGIPGRLAAATHRIAEKIGNQGRLRVRQNLLRSMERRDTPVSWAPFMTTGRDALEAALEIANHEAVQSAIRQKIDEFLENPRAAQPTAFGEALLRLSKYESVGNLTYKELGKKIAAQHTAEKERLPSEKKTYSEVTKSLGIGKRERVKKNRGGKKDPAAPFLDTLDRVIPGVVGRETERKANLQKSNSGNGLKFSLSKLESIAENPDQITDDDPPFLQQAKHFVTHGLIHLTSEISEMDPAFKRALEKNPDAKTPEEVLRAMRIATTNDSRKAEDEILAAHIRADNSKLIDLAIKYTKPGAFRDWLVKKIRRIVAPFHQAQNIQKVMFMIAERIYWNGEKMIAAPGFRTQDESGNYIYTWENSLVDGETALKAFNQLPQELKDILIERAKKNEQYRQEFVNKWIPRRKVTVGLGAMARILKQLNAGEKRADQNRNTWEKLTKGVNKNLNELESKLTSAKGQAAVKQLRERFDFLKNRFEQDNSGILKTLETVPESERSIGSLMHEYNSISGNQGHFGYVHHAFEAKQAKNLSPGSGFDASGKFDHPWFETVSDPHRIREGGTGRVGSLMQADIAQRVKEIRADRRNDWMAAIEDEYGITPESVMDEKGNIQLPEGYDNKSWVVANFGKFAGQKIYVPINVFALYKATLDRGTVDPELKEISGILDSANQAVRLINEAMLYHPAKFARDLYSVPFHIAEFIRDWTIKNPADWADVWSLLGKGIKSAVSPSEWQRMNPASFGEYSESLAFQDRKNDSLITRALNAVSGNRQAGSVLASLLKQINLAGAADLPIKRIMKVVGEGLADKRGLKGQERERFVYKIINQYAFDTGDLPGFFSFIRGGRPDSTSKVLGAVSRGTIPFMGYATRLTRQLLVTPFTHGVLGAGERTDWKYRIAEVSRPLVWMAGAMLIRAGALGNPPEEEEAAGGLKNKRDLDYAARTATRILVKRDDDKDGGEYYMAVKGYGHLSLADSVLGAIRGNQTWGDVVQELGNLHPAAKMVLSTLGMEDPYSKNIPFSAKAGRMAAMLLLPQSTRLGNDIERLLRLALKDGALPDQERDNFFTAFISQLGIPVTDAKYRNGKIVTTKAWIEAVKAAGFNIRYIPYEVVEGEVNKEIPSLKRLAEKIKKIQVEGARPWEGQKNSDGKPMTETQWLISKGLLGKGRTLEEAREAMEKDLQERSSGLAQTVKALKRVEYEFDEVVDYNNDYAKQVQSAIKKLGQPKSEDIFKRLLKNAR